MEELEWNDILKFLSVIGGCALILLFFLGCIIDIFCCFLGIGDWKKNKKKDVDDDI